MAKATILGNVGGVPNVITTSGDVKFATFAVATNSAYKDTNTGVSSRVFNLARISLSSSHVLC